MSDPATKNLVSLSRLINQVHLLLWKRFAESTKNKLDFVRLFMPPIIFFALIPLGYASLPAFADGAIEVSCMG
jgi:hypothetical protein